MEQITMEPKETPVPPVKRKSRRVWAWILLWVISIALTASLTFLFARIGDRSEYGTLFEALRTIRENYYFYDKENDGLVTGAIRGMVNSLGDVYSAYYTAEEYAELTKSQSGHYTGIGILLKQLEIGSFVVERVYENSPAEEAGILAGDHLLSINGTSAQGLDIETFLDAMKTEEGDLNELFLERDGTELSVQVASRQIYAPTVTYRMLMDSIGYLHLSQFHGECVTEIKEAIESLREQGMESLVLDLRGNPGGSLYDACDVADLFLPKGLVITSLRTRNGSSQEFKTEKEGYSFPLAVLINGETGSASELVSGALQDHGRAKVIGTQSYGKGIVQTYCYLGATGGYIKLTTEAYYTPNGVCIHGVGITPDEVVENPEEASQYYAGRIPQELDEQLRAAVRTLAKE